MKQLLSDAIDDYRRYRVSQQMGKGTLANDRFILKAFLANAGNIYAHNITDRHVTEFISHRAETRRASSLALDHSILSTFFEWLRRSKRTGWDFDPMLGRRPPKPVTRERLRIPVSKFPHLLDVAEARSPRNRALVAVGLFALLRDSEMRSLRLRDVDLDSGYLLAQVHKTKQQDRLPISQALDAELRRWLTHYAERCGTLEPDWFLLPRLVRPVTKDEAGHWVGDPELRMHPSKPLTVLAPVVGPILADAGFAVRDDDGRSAGEGAHTLRRSGARALHDALAAAGHPAPVRIVQSMLHHKTQAMTEHYIGVEPERRTRDELVRSSLRYAFEAATPIRSVHDEDQNDTDSVRLAPAGSG